MRVKDKMLDALKRLWEANSVVVMRFCTDGETIGFFRKWRLFY